MATLADAIEAYLKELLSSQGGYVEIRRCDLADSFSCAPSQINYVLETRFSTEHGYIVESRRGGGGYIRIQRVRITSPASQFSALCELIGQHLDDLQAQRLLLRLVDSELITPAQALRMRAFLNAELSGLSSPWSEFLRAGMFKAMLLMLLEIPETNEGEGPEQ
jgi:transcriptional regulator CtsR